MKIKLKNIITPFLIFTSLQALFGLRCFADSGNQAATAATALARRIVPSMAGNIVFVQSLQGSGKDFFELESKNGKVVITGNNSNSMAVGLNHYLKYYCLVSVTWNIGDNISVPVAMPVITDKIHQNARVQNRFFLNYCTLGYTMPWWQWKDWEWFIDWMALNGVNMPLAITGEEAVWYNVWKKLGLSDLEIRSFFTGPAFLPWHRMANIDHWDGPLPQSWIAGQAELQKLIVKRERQLGMNPILPAFAGHVPEVLKAKYPSSKISSLGNWGGFSKEYHSYFLDPFDPLFPKIQKEFLTEQTRLFGTGHIYGTDPFNEVTPPSLEPDYLASSSKTIYTSMQAVDPQSKWLQMGWMFYFAKQKWTQPRVEAFLKAVPQGKMILLDYYCDKQEVWKISNKFYGQPYLWCYLGNFGSNTMLEGNLSEVENSMENAFVNGGNNMWGIGSTLEGFGVNEVMYAYVLEKAWSSGPVDTHRWITNWAKTRCGKNDTLVSKAWDVLDNKIYKQAAALGQGTLTNSRPSFGENDSWPANPKINYDNRDLLKVWQLLNRAANENSPAVYNYDLVNIGRQVLGNYFFELRNRFKEAYNKHEHDKLKAAGGQMLDLINDMDKLLATNTNFLMGKWINDARALGINEVEKKYYERDARSILTTWGPQGGELTDYANRNWAGLTKDYYGKRWAMFIDDVIQADGNNKLFDQKAFNKRSSEFEWNWTMGHNDFSSVPIGNSLMISKALCEKYQGQISDVN